MRILNAIFIAMLWVTLVLGLLKYTGVFGPLS